VNGKPIGLNMSFTPWSAAKVNSWPVSISVKKKISNYWECDITLTDEPIWKINRTSEPIDDYGLL